MAADRNEIGPSELEQLLPAFIEEKVVLCIHGQPGIGKSQIVKRVCEEMGRQLKDVRLGQIDSIDLRGIPVLGKDHDGNANMKFAIPSFLPTDPNSTDVIFLDEITAAPQSVQVAALQLVLDRRLGDYIVPPGVAMICAGNRSSDKAGCRDLPAPLANRMAHVHLKTRFSDFQVWAIKNDLSPEIIGYLSFAEQNLNTFDPKSPDPAQATPRSWEMFSKMLKSGRIPKHLIFDVGAGLISAPIMHDFQAQRDAAGNLPAPKDIFTGKVKQWKANNVSAQYTVVVACGSKLKAFQDAVEKKELTLKEWDGYANNYLEFITTNISPEVAMLSISSAVRTLKLNFHMIRHPKYREFYEKNSKVLSVISQQN